VVQGRTAVYWLFVERSDGSLDGERHFRTGKKRHQYEKADYYLSTQFKAHHGRSSPPRHQWNRLNRPLARDLPLWATILLPGDADGVHR
jgi:hypothetical protein